MVVARRVLCMVVARGVLCMVVARGVLYNGSNQRNAVFGRVSHS